MEINPSDTDPFRVAVTAGQHAGSTDFLVTGVPKSCHASACTCSCAFFLLSYLQDKDSCEMPPELGMSSRTVAGAVVNRRPRRLFGRSSERKNPLNLQFVCTFFPLNFLSFTETMCANSALSNALLATFIQERQVARLEARQQQQRYSDVLF